MPPPPAAAPAFVPPPDAAPAAAPAPVITQTTPVAPPAAAPAPAPSAPVAAVAAPPATPPAPARPVLRKGVKPLRQARPEYPRRALQDEIEGDVLARAQVGRDGRVVSVTIVSARPRGVFERVVEQALRQYEFPPDDIEYVVEVPFSFRLE
jgi:protein TonB